jgi:putative membrane protein
MKKAINLLFAFLGSGIMLASCSKDNNNNFTMTNQDFVNQASSSNNFEIASGSLAKSKGVDDSVKMYGNHMVNDHGTTATEMAALASQKGLTIPIALLPKHQRSIDTLNSLSGSAFDKKYAAMMVLSHRETIALFQQAADNNGVPDQDIRSFATRKLAALRLHLQDALLLQAKVGM